jgi:hypothetical protein
LARCGLVASAIEPRSSNRSRPAAEADSPLGVMPGRPAGGLCQCGLVMLDGADPRPILLVDVDGVLNPWLAEGCPDGFALYEFFPGERVLLSPAHGRLLTSLGSAFELVWATAWEHQANELITPVLAMPELPVIEFPLSDDLQFRKLPAVIRAVGNRPCAWIDDEHQPDHYTWARKRDVPTLIIDIDPAVGLTTDVAERLADWAAALPAGRPK